MSSTRISVLASAAQTATAQGGAIAVGNLKELTLVTDVTVASGSLGVYMQASMDGGTTWADMLATSTCIYTTGAGPVTSTTFARNVFGSNTGVVLRALSTYAVFGDYIRPAWFITGSGATFTFSMSGVGKN